MSIVFREQVGGRSGKTEGSWKKDKTSKNQSWVKNCSVKEIQAEDQDDELRQLINAKRQMINFPAATAEKQWEYLDSKIILKLDSLVGDSTFEHKLATFRDIVYQTSLETFGARQYQSKGTKKKQKEIWQHLKARHSALSKAPSLCISFFSSAYYCILSFIFLPISFF
ncbi:reverse transcriptase [Elysia marginata]|uniref:Reverse transcriptase n=1 Tax=Elysia marginata TaxID=1093978 RepID=A0AAV4HLT7_9GAST|nr:reverse transcriptase [Elysia marginata]